MKDTLPYFSHDNNARRHPKMKALIAEYGYEGYGRFWALSERIAESSGACIDITKKVNRLDLAQELGFNGDGLDAFLAFLSDPEIDLVNFKDGVLTTDLITEIFSKTMECREEDKKRKMGKKEKDDFPPGKDDFPPGIQAENEEFQMENDRDKTKQNKTKQNKTKQNKTKQIPEIQAENEAAGFSDPEKLFLHIWQTTPEKVFNSIARIENPKDWTLFWSASPPSPEEVRRVMRNIIDDVKSGDLDPRFIPKTPDRFVLGGGFIRHQRRKQNVKKTSPPIANDKVEDVNQYFTEAET